MRITAKIKSGSHIDRRWRDRTQKAGQVSGVNFVLTPDGFVSEELNQTQIAALQHNSAVLLELMAVFPTPVEQTVAKVEDEKTEKEELTSFQTVKRSYNKRS